MGFEYNPEDEDPHGECRHEIHRLQKELASANAKLHVARDKLSEIACTEGVDAGVVLLSHESPTDWNEHLKCHVYRHTYFSPLGDALVELAEILK